MVFSSTDVGSVLKALGVRTGANIIYVAGKEKVSVTMSVKVRTTEEAIQSVAASSGLAYRKVGGMFVVAAPSNMRQALEPYSDVSLFTLKVGKAADIYTKIQDHLPYSTIQLKGARIEVKGLPEDLALAKKEIDEYESDVVAKQIEQTSSCWTT